MKQYTFSRIFFHSSKTTNIPTKCIQCYTKSPQCIRKHYDSIMLFIPLRNLSIIICHPMLHQYPPTEWVCTWVELHKEGQAVRSGGTLLRRQAVLNAGWTRRSLLLFLGHLCASSQLEHDGPCKRHNRTYWTFDDETQAPTTYSSSHARIHNFTHTHTPHAPNWFEIFAYKCIHKSCIWIYYYNIFNLSDGQLN